MRADNKMKRKRVMKGKNNEKEKKEVTHNIKVKSVVVGSMAYKNAFEPQTLSTSLVFMAALVSMVSVSLTLFRDKATVCVSSPASSFFQDCDFCWSRQVEAKNVDLSARRLRPVPPKVEISMQEADANEDPRK